MVHADPTGSWIDRARALSLPSQMIIGGRSTDSASGQTVEVISPRDGQAITAVPAGGPADVDAAVAAARRAFGPWSALRPADRKLILHRLADAIEGHRDELALLVALEMGKPIEYAHAIEMRTTIACYRWYAEWADKLAGEIPEVGPDAVALVTREPVGVVGVVVPWNFPMTLSAWKIAPALAAGCTVVVRPSDLSRLSAVRLAEIALAAGLPDGVLNVVTGKGRRTGQALGLHPGVDSLAFTGSTETGRAYLRYAADSNLKRVWLELGGFYLEPTVLDGVRPEMAIARDEVFGPVLSVLTFDDEDEAVRLANDSVYGLAAAVWTRDVSAAHRISRRLQAGTVWVNCYEEGDMTVPFGGVKQSGNGRDKSVHALEKYTELKTTWIQL